MNPNIYFIVIKKILCWLGSSSKDSDIQKFWVPFNEETSFPRFTRLVGEIQI